MPVGQYEIVLSFLPADSLNYESVERMIAVTVHPKVAIISAIHSLSIVYGEEITEGRLEALLLSNDVEGKFEFSTNSQQCVNPFADLMPVGNSIVAVRFVTPEGFTRTYGEKLTADTGGSSVGRHELHGNCRNIVWIAAYSPAGRTKICK
jgi:hypothetical protein